MFSYFTNFFSSPLEPFVVHPLIVFLCIKSGIDLSLTNLAATLITLLFFSVYFFASLSSKKDSTFYIIPSRYQLIVEKLYVKILALVLGNIRGASAQRYFPFIYYIFLYISLLNGIGLIPYTFTVTSHLAP